MARFVKRVFFPSSEDIPKPESIRYQVEVLTGLDVFLDEIDTVPGELWYSLSHSEFPDPVHFRFLGNAVYVDIEGAKASYLEWMTVAALVHLGGSFSKKLPRFTKVKWHERKWWHFLPRQRK